MFEGIVVSLLNKLLGKYVDNLDTNQLSISVWKGDVVFQNLRLRKDALRQLNLPIDVLEGYLGELVLNFSWSDFKNTPVNLKIKDVLLLAIPRTETDYNEELEEKELLYNKLQKIQKMELEEIELLNENNDKQETYMTQLMAKIIDNLQISINNIHIRYEDSKSNPNSPFSIGITISQLTACSSNEEWKEEFVKESNTTYKLLNLEGLSLYWNTNSEIFSNKSSYNFFEMMKIDLNSSIQFILKPVSGTGKLIMNKNTDVKRLMTKIDIVLDEFGLIIDEEQYQNIWLLIDNFSNYKKSEKYRKFRPPQSMTPKTHPRQWFQYFGKCVLYEIHEKNYKSSWAYFKQRRDDRHLYIKLYQQVLLGTTNQNVQDELKELEKKLSFDDIKYYRNLTKSILKTNNTVKPKLQPQNIQRKSWLKSWWNKDENDSHEENQIVTDEDLKMIYKAIDFDPNFELRKEDLPPDFIMLNLIFNLNRGSLTFIQQPHSKNPVSILYSNIDNCILDFIKRPTSLRADVKISDFILKDEINNNSKFSELIKAQNTKNIIEENKSDGIVKPFLNVAFENNPIDKNIDYSLDIQMKPLEVNYNYEIIDNLIKFVTRPTIQPETLISVKNAAETTFEKIKSQTRAGLDYLLMTRKIFDLKIDAEAPIFLFRQRNNNEFLIIDAGNLIIKSEMIDKEKKEYLQNKIGQKLTIEEEKTLNSLLYDKFSIDLNSVQVLAGSSLENYEQDILSNSKLSKYDIIEKTNISFLLENCILPKNNTDSPQCKINGTLPKLVLNFTDEKYLIFMNTLSNVLSLFSRDDISTIENHSSVKPSFFDILSDDIYSRVVDDDEFFDAKEESNDNIKNEIDLFSISDLEFNFNMNEIIAKVGKYDKNTKLDETIANMVLLKTEFVLIKRLFDTKIITKIENIFVEDNAQELDSEFRKVLVASEPDSNSPMSREKPLISIEYMDVNPSSPEYRGIGRRIDFNLAALDLFISNSNVMEIYDFITKTFINNNGNNDNSPNEVIINSNTDISTDDINTTLIGINMKGVNIIANNGKYRISTCNIHTGEIMIYTQQRKLFVTGQLEDLLIVDNIKRVETGRHYYQLLSTKGNKALDFKFIKYDPNDKVNYPGYDMSLYLRADSIHYTHLNPLINDLYEFFNEMRELYETAKDKAIQSASQIKENTSKIVVDIDIQTPIIEFPKGSLQSKDHLIVYLGEINMKNESSNHSPQSIDSSKSMENQNLIPNKFNIDINSMNAVSHYYFGDNEQVLQILKDVNVKLNFTLGDLIRDDDVPRIEISSSVTDINIQLTEKQYLHILELYHTIFKSNENNNIQVNNLNSNNSYSYIKNEDNLIKSISHSNLNLNPTINCEIFKSKSSINSDFSNSNLDLSYKKSFCMKLNIPLIKLETFLGDGNGIEDLEEIGHTSLQIYKSQVYVVMSSNDNIDIKVGITSFTMNDICLSHHCVFREIIPVQSSEKRFANIYFRRDSNKNSFLNVEVNNPKIIFALNTLFELKNFFFNPLNIPISSIQENVFNEIFPKTNTMDLNNENTVEDDLIFYNVKTKDKMKLVVSVNNPEITLLENHELHNTEAVVLSAKKVIIDNGEITKFYVQEIGAFLCVFEEKESTSLRLISNFDINVSLDSQNPSPGHLFKKIILNFSFLELRISYWDFFLFDKIYEKTKTYLNDSSFNENVEIVSNKKVENNTSTNLIMKHEELEMYCEGIHIILIDDLKGLHIQTIDGKIDEFRLNVQNWSTSLIAQTCLPIELNFFNIKSSHWEPLIEPWKFNVNIFRKNANSELNCELSAKDKLNINVCHDTINSLINTYLKFNNQKNRNLQSRRIETYPYILRNRTGSDIVVWTESKEADLDISLNKIPNNGELKLKLTDWRNMREREKVIENKLNIQINTSMWETIKSIPVDQEKTISYLLRPLINHIVYVLVVDIKVIDNIKYVTFRSSSILKNRTDLNLDILIMGNKTTQYSIGPMEDFYIPIMDTYNGKIKIKPKDEKDKSYSWSDEAFMWSNFRNSNTEYLNCSSSKNLFYFKIYNETSKNKLQEHLNMTYSIVPPLEIENLLPYSIKFCVLGDKSKGDICESYISYIFPGKSYPIYELNTNSILGLSINIFDIDFQQKEASIINDSKFGSIDKYITLYNIDGFELKLHLCYANLTTGTKRVSIMCPYIIYNKTDLDIIVNTRKIINTNTQSNNLILRKSRKKIVPNLFSFSNQFNPLSNRALLKVPNSELSKPISFEAVGSSYDVNIPMINNDRIELGINVTEGQGKYHNVKVITISPRYIIVNKLNEKLKIKQIESNIESEINKCSSISLDKFKDVSEKNICFRLVNQEDEWTAPINIDSIGTFYLKLTKVNSNHEDLIKVDIILNNATVYISLTKSVIWPIRIINESRNDVIIYQKNPKRKYKVLTNYSISYALDNPCDPSKVIIMEIFNSKFEINILDIRQITPIEVTAGNRAHNIIIQKNYEGPILIIKIQELSTLNRKSTKIEDIKNNQKLNISVQLPDIGISLINKDVKEFLYISLKQIALVFKEDEKLQKVKLLVRYLQIDNQLFNALEEVILYPTTHFDNKDEIQPIIQMSFSKNKSLKYGVNYFEYFDSLIQEFSLNLDEELLHSLIEFMNFSSLQRNNEENDILLKETNNINSTMLDDTNKLYFEVFQLQPIKANISFARIEHMDSEVEDSEYNRNNSNNIFTYIADVLTMTIGNIHNAPLDLHALILEHPTVDSNLLFDLIKTHYSQEVMGQLHKILGSADLIGNPVSLFNSISSGVYDIFYEPIQGFISDRPQDIGIGLATGTGKFVLKTISGFSSSFSQISGSIGKGLSLASMDQKFYYQRQMSVRNKPKHALGGISTGVTQLGKSVGSAISGVVEQPVSGLQKDGFGGFIKGVGKGIVGAFTKPVVGVFDLASNVTEGLKNTTNINELECSRIRYPRHIANNKILKVYNEKEAKGQYLKNHLYNGKYVNEDYIAHIELSEDNQVLIQTEQRLLYIDSENNKLLCEITLDELNSIELTVNIIIIKYHKKNNPQLFDRKDYIKDHKEALEFVDKVNEVLSLYKYEKLRLIKQ